jgi:hypothetical protein
MLSILQQTKQIPLAGVSHAYGMEDRGVIPYFKKVAIEFGKRDVP